MKPRELVRFTLSVFVGTLLSYSHFFICAFLAGVAVALWILGGRA